MSCGVSDGSRRPRRPPPGRRGRDRVFGLRSGLHAGSGHNSLFPKNPVALGPAHAEHSAFVRRKEREGKRQRSVCRVEMCPLHCVCVCVGGWPRSVALRTGSQRGSEVPTLTRGRQHVSVTRPHRRNTATCSLGGDGDSGLSSSSAENLGCAVPESLLLRRHGQTSPLMPFPLSPRSSPRLCPSRGSPGGVPGPVARWPHGCRAPPAAVGSLCPAAAAVGPARAPRPSRRLTASPVPCRSQEPPQDSVIATYEEHEDSVYAVEWSSADPWLFASLSYDGRLVVNRVPRALKYHILL